MATMSFLVKLLMDTMLLKIESYGTQSGTPTAKIVIEESGVEEE